MTHTQKNKSNKKSCGEIDKKPNESRFFFTLEGSMYLDEKEKSIKTAEKNNRFKEME